MRSSTWRANVAQESPELYFEIQSLNDYGAESLEALSKAVERLRAAVHFAGFRRRSIRSCAAAANTSKIVVRSRSGVREHARLAIRTQARRRSCASGCSALTEEVQRNELLLRKTQAREIELLRAHSLGELFDRVVSGLRDAYALDLVTLSLFDPQHELRHLSGNENLSSAVIEDVRFIDAVSPLAPKLAQFDRPWLGAVQSRRTTSCWFSPALQAGQHRAHSAAARQPRHRRHRVRQPRLDAIHRAIWPRTSSRTSASSWRSAWKTR